MLKPILFNTDMVRAILEGRKTVTRRVVKPLPPCELRQMPEGYHAGEWHLYSENPLIDKVNHSPWGAQFIPPFQPDDILWVRETWNYGYIYKADAKPGDPQIAWRPSIHMPKVAARIFLRVTEVRVERLREITDHGARREGCGDPDVVYYNGALECEFADLWNSTIKPADLDKYGWAANPWVWVTSFERCEKPEACPI